jgi:hypothetical protein
MTRWDDLVSDPLYLPSYMVTYSAKESQAVNLKNAKTKRKYQRVEGEYNWEKAE